MAPEGLTTGPTNPDTVIFEGVVMDVTSDGRIAWCSQWSALDGLEERGLVRTHISGPENYNHITSYWLGEEPQR